MSIKWGTTAYVRAYCRLDGMCFIKCDIMVIAIEYVGVYSLTTGETFFMPGLSVGQHLLHEEYPLFASRA